MYHFEFFEIFFRPYSDVSMIKSSIRNPMDDFEIFFDCNIFLSKNAAISGRRLVDF